MKRTVVFLLVALAAAGGGYAMHLARATAPAAPVAGARDPLMASFKDLQGNPRALAQ